MEKDNLKDMFLNPEKYRAGDVKIPLIFPHNIIPKSDKEVLWNEFYSTSQKSIADCTIPQYPIEDFLKQVENIVETIYPKPTYNLKLFSEVWIDPRQVGKMEEQLNILKEHLNSLGFCNPKYVTINLKPLCQIKTFIQAI